MLAFRIKSSLRDLRHERRDSKRLRGARFLKRNVPCVSRNRMLFNLALGRYFRLVDFTVIVYQRVMATRYCLFTRKVEGTLTCSPCLWNEVTTSFTTNTREKIEMNRLNHNYPESCVSQRFRRWIVPKVDYIYIYIEHVFDAYFSKKVILNLVPLFVAIAQYQLLRISLKFNA